jgi:hypothetical protein
MRSSVLTMGLSPLDLFRQLKLEVEAQIDRVGHEVQGSHETANEKRLYRRDRVPPRQVQYVTG